MDSFKRQVAKKARIRDLVEGRYIRVEGEWEPNFIQAADGNTFSRVNIVSVVVSDPVQDSNLNTFTIDDGTGRLPVRVFGEDSLKTEVRLGDIILLIGRPREFGQQIYIVPEIIKKIDNTKWIDYRKLELELLEQESGGIAIKKGDIQTKDMLEKREPAPEEESAEIKEESVSNADDTKPAAESNPIEKIIETIRLLDKGDGADTEEVISSSDADNAEKIIDSLLKEGEIFEVRSGRIKLLE